VLYLNEGIIKKVKNYSQGGVGTRREFKKYRIWLLVFTTLLLITHILFKTPAPFPWLEHVWDAGDFLSFIGTMVLGYVAFTQANDANKINNRLLKIEETQYKLELLPFIMVSDYSAYIRNTSNIINNPDKTYIMVGKPDNDNDDVLCLEFSLLNTTNSYVTVKYSNAELSGSLINWVHSVINQKDDIIRLQPGVNKPLVLYAPPTEFKKLISEKITLRFILENRFGERYAEYFNIIILALREIQQNNWYISMLVHEYSIKRFGNDKSGKEIEVQEDSHYRINDFKHKQED